MKTDYWLYLASDVFIWLGDFDYYVYNCNNKCNFRGELSSKLRECLTKLIQLDSLCCIEVNRDSIDQDDKLRIFVEMLSTFNCGGLKQKTNNKIDKPLGLPPYPNIQTEIKRKRQEYFRHISYINSIAIIFDDKINIHNVISSFEELILVKPKITIKVISKSNTLQSSLVDFIHSTSIYSKEICLSLDLILFEENYSIISSVQNKLSNLIIRVNKNNVNYLNNTLKTEIINIPITIKYPIETELDIASFERFEKEFEPSHINILPYLSFNGSNIDFISNSIAFSRERLKDIPLSKSDIFRRMLLNPYFFGKFIIDQNGFIKAPLSNQRLYSITDKDCWEKSSKKELESKNSIWLYTRDNGKCHHCCYRFVCPSPSRIELLAKISAPCIEN